jgi:selenophosphate synthetase-related protein
MLTKSTVLAATLVTTALSFTSAAERDEKPAEKESAKESITVEIRGTLNTGVFAIGGETTGTTITASGLTFELELGDKPELVKQAESLDGQSVIVTGTLEGRKGVEIPLRWIVTVKSLKLGEKQE